MMEPSAITVEGVVAEIMKLHRSLPLRPSIEEIEAAKTLLLNIEREDQLRIEGLSKQKKGKDVPDELFNILQELQRSMVHFQCKEGKKEALKMLDLESIHQVFDDLIQRASRCLPGSQQESESVKASSTYSPSTNSLSSSVTNTTTSTSSLYDELREENLKAATFLFSKDDSYVKKPKAVFPVDGFRTSDAFSVQPQIVDPTLKKPLLVSGQDGGKLSLVKLASLVEVSAKKRTMELNLRGKFTDQVEWLPDSIGKLSGLITLDLSENRIILLPDTIGGLAALQSLDLHGNVITKLPEPIGDLLDLIRLDLRGNQLRSLPSTISTLGRLEELDLSSNAFSVLPETIGSLFSLKKLDVEYNEIEEIPHTISRCTSLKEFRADYNKLKALPEAVGRIESLEILSVRYNNIKQLPTTMASLTNLKELNVSFNELESVPESLCFVTTLVKMNISNNFAQLQSLPRSIGNLEMLEELDMCNNQIRVLPESFRLLTKLRVLNVEGNPLALPPRDVIEKGPQAIVQYMADLSAQREVESRSIKQKKPWAQLCCFSKSNKRKRNSYGVA